MSAVPDMTFLSEAEFLALPESHERIELLDGEVVVSPAPTNIHQILVGTVYRLLCAWADTHPPAFVGLSPFDVRLGPNRVVQPDLFVLLGGLHTAGLLCETPELVVEVLSSNRSHDRLAKRMVYAQAGVREYWMVDPRLCHLELVVDGEHRLETQRFESVVAPGLVVDVPALFAVVAGLSEG